MRISKPWLHCTGGKTMLFHEVYGSYYRTVSLILKEAVRGTLTKKAMTALVREHAFGESVLSIPDGLTGERWRLLRQDLTTPLEKEPEMPLTLLEKRWLKALLLDPRIILFDPDPEGLEDVEPLFSPDMLVWYDRFGDGDDFSDPAYVRVFRTVLSALRGRRNLSVCYEGRRGARRKLLVTPHCLEYSEKDDRFRLYAADKDRNWILNLSRILDCGPAGGDRLYPLRPLEEKMLSFELTDERNALERVLLHFSHLRKETKRLDRKRYLVTLYYDSQDGTEMLIRLLSFGPVIRVTEPPEMIALMRGRIERQRRLLRGSPEDGTEPGA